MTPTLPQCCLPEAFGLLNEHMPSLDSTDSLVAGAVAIATQYDPGADLAWVDATLQAYADRVRERVRGEQPQALLAHLHDILFHDEAFEGNADDYYNPQNSFLPSVLKSKKGLPITLSLIYKSVAERLGLRVWGVALPGHFLVAVGSELHDRDAAPMLIDPFFHGRLLTADEAHARMKDLFGPEIEWSQDLLRPATHRHWLTRILQNLLHIFGNDNRLSDVAAVLEMEMILWPGQAHLQRDLGLVLARIGLAGPASIWLGKYLRDNPQDPQRNDLKQLLDVLSA